MNLALVFLLYVLAVMRVTRLINFDTIMDWLHIGLGHKFGPGSWQVEFAKCPWCIGMWVSLATAWAPLLFAPTLPVLHYVVLYLIVALAASMVTGLASPLSSEDTDLEPLPPR